MGIVWEATNVATDRHVAVKLVAWRHAANKELRARMVREARAYGRIAHKNVIEILDAGETEEGEPFLVMPLLRGEDLASLLERRGALDPPSAVRIAIDVAKGLAAAHAVGLIHRDLKPANVFLVQDDDEPHPVVKILDLGVSKLVDPAEMPTDTLTGGAIGSPSYMSPEQARGDKDVDQRSDLWTLGVLLFEMLTGTRAFDGSNVFEVAAKILEGPIPLVKARAPAIDGSLAALIERCLVREVDGRISSAAEFIAAARNAVAAPVVAGGHALDPTIESTVTLVVPTVLQPGAPPQFAVPDATSRSSLRLGAGVAVAVAAAITLATVIAVRTRQAPSQSVDDPSATIDTTGPSPSPASVTAELVPSAVPSASAEPTSSTAVAKPKRVTPPTAPSTTPAIPLKRHPRPERRPASSSSVPFDDPG